jgi:calcineurin-like phosphoesterase family protein
MNEIMIDNWNKKVKPTDTIYHLGDFGFGELRYIIERLNGKKYLTIGSHDSNVMPYFHLFEDIKAIIDLKDVNIVLCHYAMRVWSRSHYGSWHLYGHSHGMIEPWGKSFDVGVDCWKFSPISLDQVRKEMEKRPDNFNQVKKEAK